MTSEPTQCAVSELPRQFAAQPGSAPSAPLFRGSHFSEELSDYSGPRGRSRRWGDAPLAVQREVVGELLRQARTSGLSRQATAYLLAVVRVESGFNPDAASGSSSAAGLGQFIDATGKAYGLGNDNRFDLRANARAVVAHLQDCLKIVRSRYSAEAGRWQEYWYAVYHDGPKLGAGGREIARRRVVPWYERFYRWLECR